MQVARCQPKWTRYNHHSGQEENVNLPQRLVSGCMLLLGKNLPQRGYYCKISECFGSSQIARAGCALRRRHRFVCKHSPTTSCKKVQNKPETLQNQKVLERVGCTDCIKHGCSFRVGKMQTPCFKMEDLWYEITFTWWTFCFTSSQTSW